MELSIGNDIVDLEAECSPLHPRYCERVCTPSEIELIGDDHSMLWRIWSAKEAAFKAVRRILPNTPFIPRQFEYSPEGAIVHSFRRIPIRHTVGAGYVAALALLGHALDTASVIEWICDAAEEESLSARVRSSGIEIFARRFGAPPQSFHIPATKQKGEPPALFVDGARSADLLTLSHHGRFGYGAFLDLRSEEDMLEAQAIVFPEPRGGVTPPLRSQKLVPLPRVPRYLAKSRIVRARH